MENQGKGKGKGEQVVNRTIARISIDIAFKKELDEEELLRSAMYVKSCIESFSLKDECPELGDAESITINCGRLVNMSSEKQVDLQRKIQTEQTVKTRKVGLFCSFCGKSQKDAVSLIAGPLVYICDECVVLCADIISEKKEEEKEKEVQRGSE